MTTNAGSIVADARWQRSCGNISSCTAADGKTNRNPFEKRCGK